MEAVPPLVGRDIEIETLLGHLGHAHSSNGGLVLISGEAGMGKTRIVQYLMRKAEEAGFLTLIGRCIPGMPSPYLPYREAFSKLYGGISSSGPFAASSPGEILFNALDLLIKEAHKAPLLICIEDLHWADSLTVQLSHFLARNIRDQKILLVGTYRPEDLSSEIEGTEHPLKNAIRNMNREEILTDISLAPISEAHIIEAIEGMLGSSIDLGLARKISDDSEGNPLFFVETIRSLLISDSLFLDGDHWNIREGREIDIPSTIRDMVILRFSRLSRVQSRMIENASVIGEYFRPDQLCGLQELNILDLVDELDLVSKGTYLIVEEGKRYRFAHAKVRTVIYENISKSRRTHMHLRYANFLESNHLEETDYTALSWHYYQADDVEKCISYSLQAGKVFLKENSPQEAVVLLRRSLERIANDDKYHKTRLDVLESLGDAHHIRGELQESWSCYEKVLDSCSDRNTIARVYRKSADNWTPNDLGKGDGSMALFLLEKAESIGDSITEEKAYIQYHHACVNEQLYNSIKAYEQIKEASSLFDEIGNEKMVIRSQHEQCVIMTRLSLIEEGLALARSILPRAYELGDKEEIVQAEFALGVLLHLIGHPDEAIPHYSKQIDIASKLGINWYEGYGYSYRAMSLNEMGEFNAALEDGRKAENIARMMNHHLHIFFAISRIARSYLGLNIIDGTESCLAEMNRIRNETTGPRRLFMEAIIERTKACLLEKQDDVAGSFQAFEKSVEKFNEVGGEEFRLAKTRFAYAQCLAAHGEETHANDQLLKAFGVFSRMHNLNWTNKVEEFRKALNVSGT